MLNISSQIGNKIKEYRNKVKLSQEALAIKAEISTTFLGQIERGNKNPTIYLLGTFLGRLNFNRGHFFSTLAFRHGEFQHRILYKTLKYYKI